MLHLSHIKIIKLSFSELKRELKWQIFICGLVVKTVNVAWPNKLSLSVVTIITHKYSMYYITMMEGQDNKHSTCIYKGLYGMF